MSDFSHLISLYTEAFEVFTLFSLSLHFHLSVKSVRNTWDILWLCTTYVWHGPGGDQVEDWAQTRTWPSLGTRQPGSRGGTLAILGIPSFFGLWVWVQCAMRTWGLVCPGHGYTDADPHPHSLFSPATLAPLCVLMSPTPGPWLSRFVFTAQNII